MSTEIPDKSYFKIGEVGRILGVEPYNVRYWESQFKAIRPVKTKSGQRLYRRQDVEILLQIKNLLYNQGFTIAGARRHLEADADDEVSSEAVAPGVMGLAAEERRAYEDLLSRSEVERADLKQQVAEFKEELEHQREQHQKELLVLRVEYQAVKEERDRANQSAAERLKVQQETQALARLKTVTLETELERNRRRLHALTETVRQELLDLVKPQSDDQD